MLAGCRHHSGLPSFQLCKSEKACIFNKYSNLQTLYMHHTNKTVFACSVDGRLQHINDAILAPDLLGHAS